MLEIGVQSRNIVEDPCPEKGFRMLKDAGFSCTDFSLNSYLTNKDLYEGKVNAFFSQSIQELEQFFSAHKEGAKKAGIRINQMHMPYPVYIPNGRKEINDFLQKEMAVKSMHICLSLIHI